MVAVASSTLPTSGRLSGRNQTSPWCLHQVGKASGPAKAIGFLHGHVSVRTSCKERATAARRMPPVNFAGPMRSPLSLLAVIVAPLVLEAQRLSDADAVDQMKYDVQYLPATG